MKTVMAMVNKYGEILCELERDGSCFYKVPTRDICIVTDLLCEGDEFRVEEIVIED